MAVCYRTVSFPCAADPFAFAAAGAERNARDEAGRAGAFRPHERNSLYLK